ncbi:High affinity cAMP-specific and IBMX-insensitive 3',5'-cyclic phosphodiesterase 8B, variant 2 [Chamberlinius hualienensis]
MLFKKESREVRLGPMKIKLSPMKILLVFGSEDSQSDAFHWAANKLKYHCNLVKTAETALEHYLRYYYDLVIIDRRTSKYFDSEALCRAIRNTKDSEHTLMLGIVKKSAVDKEESSVISMLKNGFNRLFVECPNTALCMNELIQLEITEVTTRHMLRASMALFTALDHCTDAVEITNADNEIEYVNIACENLLGYNHDELVGKNIRDIHRNENQKVDLFNSITAQLSKGKEWAGTLFSRRKQGDCIPVVCHVSPIITQEKKTEHLVYVKECHNLFDKSHVFLNGKEPSHISALDISPRPKKNVRRKISYDNGPLSSEGNLSRRQSMAKTYSMTIEPPITKVINLITTAQENSPPHIAQALDDVLDILRTTELYSPQFGGSDRVEDPVTTDLIEGLLAQGPKPVVSDHQKNPKKSLTRKPVNIENAILHPNGLLASIPPNIKAILENENEWNFDILSLERVTEKRPLVWLGMSLFSSFNAFSYLKCSEIIFQNWLTLIEANYHADNTYHNSTHAADVLQATAYFLRKDRIKDVFSCLDKVGCLVAAVIHDVDHPGKTSPFLCNSSNELAILYNDLAVLENHHSAMAFRLTLQDNRVNIFKNLDRNTYQVLRETIIDMVLATEMTKHFEHLTKFVNVWSQPVHRDEPSTSAESSNDNAFQVNSGNIALVKRMIIKCADISNPVRPLHLCTEWAHRIAEEYFSQTEEEKNLGLPVCMPAFERTIEGQVATDSIPKSQSGFMDYFIRDLFETLDGFMEAPELIENMRNNYQYWKDLESPSGNTNHNEEEHDNNIS